MDSARTTRARAAHRLDEMLVAALTLLLLALAAVPVAAEPGNDNRAPDLGEWDEVQVEAGNKVAFQAWAEGVQIYRWNGAKWDFVRPEAVLYADGGNGIVAIHYGGPTWESPGGSIVIGEVIDRCTPDPDAIDWLLLRGKSSAGPGIFDGVTFIQRIHTVGGKAPAAGGDFVGQEARVPYTADYVFYREAKR